MRSTNTSHLLLFVAGTCVGAALGMMLAPASGAETRRRITGRAEDTRDFLAESGRDYIEKGRELYELGRQLVDEAAEMFDEGRRMMETDTYVNQPRQH